MSGTRLRQIAIEANEDGETRLLLTDEWNCTFWIELSVVDSERLSAVLDDATQKRRKKLVLNSHPEIEGEVLAAIERIRKRRKKNDRGDKDWAV